MIDTEKEKKIRETLTVMEVLDSGNNEKYQNIRRMLDLQRTVNRQDFKEKVLLHYMLKKIGPPQRVERAFQKAIPNSEREIIEKIIEKKQMFEKKS